MSAHLKFLSGHPLDAQFDSDIAEVREWERFKWFSRQLAPVVDNYTVAELVDLLEAPPTMPGQREKVVVLLALKRSPQALDALENFDVSRCSDGLRELLRVAIQYARSR